TDYTTASKSISINVNQATPTITWSNPPDITYGTALSSTQLDATASVPGTFAYTPASGIVLPAGNNQTLSVIFTPTDTTDYTTASKSVSINVEALQTATISGYAYVDANRNGKMDSGECLPNVTITLSGPVQETTTTNDSGWYQFIG